MYRRNRKFGRIYFYGIRTGGDALLPSSRASSLVVHSSNNRAFLSDPNGPVSPPLLNQHVDIHFSSVDVRLEWTLRMSLAPSAS